MFCEPYAALALKNAAFAYDAAAAKEVFCVVLSANIIVLPMVKGSFAYRLSTKFLAVYFPVTPVGKSTPTNIVFAVFGASVFAVKSVIFTVDIFYPNRSVLPSSVVIEKPSSVVSSGI